MHRGWEQAGEKFRKKRGTVELRYLHFWTRLWISIRVNWRFISEFSKQTAFDVGNIAPFILIDKIHGPFSSDYRISLAAHLSRLRNFRIASTHDSCYILLSPIRWLLNLPVRHKNNLAYFYYPTLSMISLESSMQHGYRAW